MHLREAVAADYGELGVIQADCNRTDTLGLYLTGDPTKYPTTLLKGATRFVRRRSAEPGTIVFVVETDDSDYNAAEKHKAPEVGAFIVATRIGTSPKAKEWKARNSGFWATVNGWLDAVEDKYYKYVPNVDSAFRYDALAKVLPYLGTPFDKEVFAEAWEVELLMVAPRWQRKGMGRRLLQRVFDIATEEKVPVLVKSSPKGATTYRACGFQSLGEVGLQHLFDTLEFGGEEPQLWCWEPPECQGMWYARGKEALEKLQRDGDGSAVAAVLEKQS